MVKLSPPERSLPRHCLWLTTLLPGLVFLGGCIGHSKSPASQSLACTALSQTLARQESSFVERVRGIRQEHILLQEYDRQMIAAITERRQALLSTSLTALPMSDEVAGCSGDGLENLRRQAHEEMSSLQSFLATFQRALKWDPNGVYIDARP